MPTYQVIFYGFLPDFVVGLLELRGPEGVCNVKGTRVEATVLITVVVVILRLVVRRVVCMVVMPVQMRSDIKGFGVERALTGTAYLLVHEVGGPGDVQGGPDAHRGTV